MADAKQRFAYHYHIVTEQQVEMLQNRTRQAVFNRNDRGIDGSLRQSIEHIGGERAGNYDCIGNQLKGRFVAE